MTGSIIDSSGAGIADAGVSAAAGGAAQLKTSTGPQGEFNLRIVHGGAFKLTVEKVGFKTLTREYTSITRETLRLAPIGLEALTTSPGGGTGGDPEPPAPEPRGDARFSLTPEGCGTDPALQCTLSIAEGVRIVTRGEFAPQSQEFTDPDTGEKTTVPSRLAGKLGSSPRSKIKSIILPNSLVRIEEKGFIYHTAVESGLTIPAAVESIGADAFNIMGSNDYTVKISLEFAANSKLKSIGDRAFDQASIAGLPRLPDSLETIGIKAFYVEVPISSLIIPRNVKSIGDFAFHDPSASGALFTGTLTIESVHLTRTPELTGTAGGPPKTGRIGNFIFGSGQNQFTAIYLPRGVFDSYSQGDLDMIFGTFARSGGRYVDIANKDTPNPPALTK